MKPDTQIRDIEVGKSTKSGQTSSGEGKVNQDASLSIENLLNFANPVTAACHPIYQLHLLCDGHGHHGHLVSTFILEHYPQILARLLLSALEEYELTESDPTNERQGPQVIMEEENEDSSPSHLPKSIERFEP